MKFQKLEVLEKHFKEAFPKHLCAIYVIIAPQESERKKILASLAQKLEEQCDLKKCSLLTDAIEHLNAASLFAGKMAAVFDGVDLLVKGELDLLSHYIKAPNPQGHFILGAASAKCIDALYKMGKKEMVVLDLSKEKPWEEKQRLQRWVVQTLAANSRRISPDAVEALFERLPNDRLILQQELDKLLCYVGDRPEITRSDIEAICSISSELNFFQLARELIWNEVKTLPTISDVGILLPLIGQLRNQLEMGLKMVALCKRGISKDEISKAFPRLWPKALQQVYEGAQRKGESYFRKGLLALYDFEFGLKTSLGKPEILFTLFCANCCTPY